MINDYFSKLTEKIPNDEEIAGTNKLMQVLISKTSKYFTMFWCKSDTILLANAVLRVQKNSIETYVRYFILCLFTWVYLSM